jgi:hypothetical protein
LERTRDGNFRPANPPTGQPMVYVLDFEIEPISGLL